MAIVGERVNLMHLGTHGLCAAGLRNTLIKENFRNALKRSGGKATTYPIDHPQEHGTQYYLVRGMRESFDPKALYDVAMQGKVMAAAVLPGMGQVFGQLSKGELPLIWKLNLGAGKQVNGDSITTRVYAKAREAMERAVNNGAKFWGATYYFGSINAPDMLRQLSEMDEAGAEFGLGGVVWNYARGTQLKGKDDAVVNQLWGFEEIINACPASLVLIKEKVSSVPGTVAEWKAQEGSPDTLIKAGWGKPGDKDLDEGAITSFLSLDRAGQIAYLVQTQRDMGYASLMSGGAPQDPEKFAKDVKDGIGFDRHIAGIAGRGTTRQIRKVGPGKYDLSAAIKHFEMLNAAAPTVVIEE